MEVYSSCYLPITITLRWYIVLCIKATCCLSSHVVMWYFYTTTYAMDNKAKRKTSIYSLWYSTSHISANTFLSGPSFIQLLYTYSPHQSLCSRHGSIVERGGMCSVQWINTNYWKKSLFYMLDIFNFKSVK